MSTPDLFYQRCVQLSARVLALSKDLRNTAAGGPVRTGLADSALSLGSFANQAKGACSAPDLVRLFDSALIEVREVAYFLEVIRRFQLCRDRGVVAELTTECHQLSAILLAWKKLAHKGIPHPEKRRPGSVVDI